MKRFFRRHFEWVALLAGLVLMGLMNPYVNTGFSFCFFEILGIPFCPGEGLGHSIAFTFRGELGDALQAHPLGPAAIIILSGRILFLWSNRAKFSFNNLEGDKPNGKDDRFFT